MRTIRLFSILDQLRGRRTPISADQLANLFDVSSRTIYRDIRTLQDFGAPIRGAAGIGFQIEDGFFLPPLHFQADELDALVLGVRMAIARGDSDLRDSAERLLGKVEHMLAGDDRTVDLPLLAVGSEQSSGKSLGISPLKSAIHERRKICMVYSNAAGETSERIARPLGLTAFENVWVLTAWCELRDSFRNFRLDRIVKFELSKERFKREHGREFRDYLAAL